MHHKRGRAKNQRAGCLMCKPHKMNGAGALALDVHKVGFGNLRAEAHAVVDLKAAALNVDAQEDGPADATRDAASAVAPAQAVPAVRTVVAHYSV